MSAVVLYRWLSPLPSRGQRRGAVTGQDLEAIETDRMIYVNPPLWYLFGEGAEEDNRVASYLLDVLRNVRAATQNFTQSLGKFATCQELATSVCEALLVIERVQIPGVPKCVMCKSPVAVRETPLSPNPAAGENVIRYPISGGPVDGWPWTLHDILVYPSWRVDSPPRLCTFHAAEFGNAFKSVLFGCVVFPKWCPQRFL